MDAIYIFNSAEQGNVSSCPLYHTSYEVFSMMKQFVDPDFTVNLSSHKLLMFNDFFFRHIEQWDNSWVF
jgi:hypothetical protein